MLRNAAAGDACIQHNEVYTWSIRHCLVYTHHIYTPNHIYTYIHPRVHSALPYLEAIHRSQVPLLPVGQPEPVQKGATTVTVPDVYTCMYMCIYQVNMHLCINKTHMIGGCIHT